MKRTPASLRAFCALGMWLTQADLQELTQSENRVAIAKFLRGLRKRRERKFFATPLSDAEAGELLVSKGGIAAALVVQRLSAWRELAFRHHYTGPVAWKVRAGYTIEHGSEKSSFRLMNEAETLAKGILNDEPTTASVAFWIPRLLHESTQKSVSEQLELLASVRGALGLPAHHLKGFGHAGWITVLSYAHRWRSGEQPLRDEYAVRTDTYYKNGTRVLDCSPSTHRKLSRLHDNVWPDSSSFENVGCYPIGFDSIQE